MSMQVIAVHTTKQDYGEFGAARCPCCGAKGRYVHNFILVDGSHAAAMAGCIKIKFSESKLAAAQRGVMEKQEKGQSLGSLAPWDKEILRIAARFQSGEIALEQANTLAGAQIARRDAAIRQRGR